MGWLYGFPKLTLQSITALRKIRFLNYGFRINICRTGVDF